MKNSIENREDLEALTKLRKQEEQAKEGRLQKKKVSRVLIRMQ